MRIILGVGILAIGAAVLPVPAALAACLPGQTCWSVTGTEAGTSGGFGGSAQGAAAQRQFDSDRAKVLRDQLQLNSARTKATLPLGSPTPLEQIEQQQDLQRSQQQLWQSQQNLQRSQQLLLDQKRPTRPAGQ